MPFSIRKGVLHAQDAAVTQVPSPNHSGAFRSPPRLIVMHYTAGGSAASSASWLANPAAGASAHLVIGRDGAIIQCVNLERRAWHAGRSAWQGLSDLNSHAIGIELANRGPLTWSPQGWCDASGTTIPATEAAHRHGGPVRGWEVYPEAQITAAIAVARALAETYPIHEIVGHDDIAPGRKLDPGPAFDMPTFRTQVLGASLRARVTASSLRVRSGPGLDHPVLRALPRGTPVEVTERRRDWIAIAPGQWVFAEHVA